MAKMNSGGDRKCVESWSRLPESYEISEKHLQPTEHIPSGHDQARQHLIFLSVWSFFFFNENKILQGSVCRLKAEKAGMHSKSGGQPET